MSIIDALIIGFVQGLTEFIPVSSSGHLLFISEMLDLGSSFQLETALNIGTLLAAIIYFRRDIFNIINGIVKRNSDQSLIKSLIIAALPVLVAGFIVGQFFSETFLSVGWTSLMLIVVGLAMIFEPKMPKPDTERAPTFKQALWIGFAQVIALIPGTSRSASTILAGRAVGLSRVEAARFSFILSIPVVSAAVLYVFIFESTALSVYPFNVMLVAIISSFASSLLAIHILLSIVKKVGLAPFGIYRVLVGVVLLFLL